MFHFHKIYQPLQKGDSIFGIPRPLQTLLVAFEQKLSYRNVSHTHLGHTLVLGLLTTVPPPVRIILPLHSPSYTYGYKIKLQKFGFNKNVSINLLYSPQKENLPKVNLKVQKGHGFTFSLKLSQLDPYIQH